MMSNLIRTSLALSFVAAALMFPAGGLITVHAQERATPFPVASVFFELNNSAGDLGIHGEIDGGPWTTLEIEGPGDRKLLSLVSKGRLRTQGMTQLAFESAEPPFKEKSRTRKSKKHSAFSPRSPRRPQSLSNERGS